MGDPRPLRTLGGQGGAQGLASRDLDRVLSSYLWPADQRIGVYWAMRARLAARQRRAAVRRIALPVVGCALVLGALLLATAPGDPPISPPAAPLPSAPAGAASAPGWTRLDADGLGLFECLGPAACRIEDRAGHRLLRLDSGALRAQLLRQDPAYPFAVETPHLRIVVVGTRFDVRVDPERTHIDLLEGTLRVERSGQSALLHAPEAFTSDDPRLKPAPAGPSPSLRPAPERPARALAPKKRVTPRSWPSARARAAADFAACESRASPSERQSCLGQVSRGTGLAAQGALFSLAMLAEEQPDRVEEALAAFREYQQRFPEGALIAEAAAREIEILMRLGRHAEAERAASAFVERFPTDLRAREIALLRATLLCGRQAGRVEGHALLQRLASDAPPDIAQTARRLLERCRPAVEPNRIREGSSSDPPALPAPGD